MTTNDPHLIKTPINSADSDIKTSDIKNSPADVNPISRDNHDSATHTQTNLKGNETLKQEVLDSEHVNEGDTPARQPDRRDQQGNAFDGGINAENLEKINAHASKHEPQSDEITDYNRYATVDNAQTRVLNNTEQGE